MNRPVVLSNMAFFLYQFGLMSLLEIPWEEKRFISELYLLQRKLLNFLTEEQTENI